IGQTEQALFEDRIALVPQGKTEAEIELVVAEASNSVLAPAVGAAAGMVVWQVVPRIAVLAVILPNGAPLPLAEIRSPATPRRPGARGREPTRLGGGRQNLLHVRCLNRHRSIPSRRSSLELPPEEYEGQFRSVIDSMCWR